MTEDRTFIERNRAGLDRLRGLVESLSDEEMQRPVGEHWTVAIALAHLAFWDRRALNMITQSEQAGQLTVPPIDVSVNDISLPLWAAIPPREAARMAIAAAEAIDQHLAQVAPELLAQFYAHNPRWVERARHRDAHLAEVEAALGR
ncbi:hypothetical protein F8S13_17150 [Chloroflexia bacterium SDU3-3]|nr:hypothetical protein F8S13_17150 [Chloroflexia bacterium SDU3-3]